MLTTGTLLQGRYRILEPLSEGGMSVVYLASDAVLGNRVAIKEMKDHFLSGAEKDLAATQFLKEAQILASLEHAGLPRVTNFFQEQTRHYLVMDFIKGHTLEHLANERGGMLPEDLVLRIASEVCRVLDYLHNVTPAVIFRDLKPSNIMVTEDHRVKLIDFGISKNFDVGTSTRTIIRGAGTPGFAPPEQYGTHGRNRTDARSDIYSLGATMYALLTGEIPAEATDRWMNGVPLERPAALNPQISQQSEALILKMMELRPEDRPPSARAVLEEVRRYRPELTIPHGVTGLYPSVEASREQGPRPSPSKPAPAAPPRPLRRFRSSVAGTADEPASSAEEPRTNGIYPFAGAVAAPAAAPPSPAEAVGGAAMPFVVATTPGPAAAGLEAAAVALNPAPSAERQRDAAMAQAAGLAEAVAGQATVARSGAPGLAPAPAVPEGPPGFGHPSTPPAASGPDGAPTVAGIAHLAAAPAAGVATPPHVPGVVPPPPPPVGAGVAPPPVVGAAAAPPVGAGVVPPPPVGAGAGQPPPPPVASHPPPPVAGVGYPPPPPPGVGHAGGNGGVPSAAAGQQQFRYDPSGAPTVRRSLPQKRKGFPVVPALISAIIVGAALAILVVAKVIPTPWTKSSPSPTVATATTTAPTAPGTSPTSTHTPTPTASGSTPTPSTSPPAYTARLAITSTPLGATVYVNGAKVGVTGKTPLLVDVGKDAVQLKLKKDGYLTYLSRIRPQAGGETPVTADLTKESVVHIHPNPHGAKVSFDGRYVGVGDADVRGLSKGTYKYKVFMDGYYAKEGTVAVGDGEEKKVSISLSAIPPPPRYEPPPYQPPTYYDPGPRYQPPPSYEPPPVPRATPIEPVPAPRATPR